MSRRKRKAAHFRLVHAARKAQQDAETKAALALHRAMKAESKERNTIQKVKDFFKIMTEVSFEPGSNAFVIRGLIDKPDGKVLGCCRMVSLDDLWAIRAPIEEVLASELQRAARELTDAVAGNIKDTMIRQLAENEAYQRLKRDGL